MGEMYKCHCNKCGYEEDFRVGGGFCTKEYWEEKRMLEARLKEEVLSGKYGNQLKNIIESDLHNFQFSYDDDILQCLNCLKFSIVRKPEIRYFHLKQSFSLEISFPIQCPNCSYDIMVKPKSIFKTICPICEEIEAEINYIGNWD